MRWARWTGGSTSGSRCRAEPDTSWLATNLGDDTRSAPAFRVSLSRSGARLAWNVGYRRSFLPSFGFGGTFENQEFEASVFGPITRRLDWSASTSVREADPLTTSELGPALRLGAFVALLPGHAMDACRRFLRRRAPGLAASWRQSQSVSRRHSSRRFYTHEDPLMEERSMHLFDYLAVVKRRRWWLAVPVAIAVLVGIALALTLPREYRSFTTLAVTTPNMTTDLVKSSPTDIAERVRAISHELLSRPVLEQVVRDEGLGNESSMDGAVAEMRGRTSVSLPKSLATTTRSGPDTFLVTYVGRTPDITQRVTNRLASTFIEQHSKLRETRAEDTSAFLSAQLGQSRDRLKAVEERLRKMKEAYMGRLPEQAQGNLQMVGGLRQQQDTATASLRSEQDRLTMLERQIESMRKGAADAPLSKVGGVSGPFERVATLQRQLDEAASMYTEKHPEIQRLKTEIVAAQALAETERTRPAADREPALNADPTYRQLVAERDTSRLRIREQQRTLAQTQGEIAKYQERVEAAPMIEQQLSSINREYELEKQQYTSLSERHQSAVLAEDLERRRAGEQFAVLYPAFLPSQPSSPDVPRVLLFSVLGGIVAAGVLVFGREYLDRSVYDVRALQNEFELPVLAEIPRIATR